MKMMSKNNKANHMALFDFITKINYGFIYY